MFGDWTTTPGGRRPFCNDTCGSYRNYWEMRSCGPAHPNLPEGQSCENLDESLTLRNSTTACVPFVPCKGDSLQMYQLCIKGDWGKWSDWSECSADCSLGKSHGEKMRQRSLRNAPFRDPDVQIQPCSKRCPPGDTGQFHDQTYMFSFRLHKPKGQPSPSVKRC